MLRSDDALELEVSAELAADAVCRNMAIGVGVKNGVVTLSGTAVDPVVKSAAIRAARRVYGIEGVHSRFEILPVGSERLSIAATLSSELLA